MTIQVKQSSKQQADGWWKWSVWLSGPKDELDQVEYAEYILHSTFRNPVQRIANRSTGFRLNASGWGEFKIYVNIGRKDGSMLKLEHWLALPAEQPTLRAQTKGIGQAAPLAEGERPLRIWVSYSISDASLANALCAALRQRGWETLLSGESTDLPYLEDLLPREQTGLDLALYIVSDARNPWLSREVEFLRRYGVPIVAVAVLSHNPRMPPELSDVPVIAIKEPRDEHEVEDAAQAVSDRVVASR